MYLLWFCFIVSQLVNMTRNLQCMMLSIEFDLQEVIAVWEKARVRDIEKEERGK